VRRRHGSIVYAVWTVRPFIDFTTKKLTRPPLCGGVYTAHRRFTP
jgi:hypothetical protein